MPAGFKPLRNHRVGAGHLRGTRFGQGGRARDPGNAHVFEALHLCRGEHAHDGRGHRRARLDQGLELCIEIGRSCIGRTGRHLRPPLRQEATCRGFRIGIAPGQRIRNPDIDLRRPCGLRAEIGHPRHDVLRLGQHRAHRAHAAGVGQRGRQRHRAGAGHRRQQDRGLQCKTPTEAVGAFEKRGTIHARRTWGRRRCQHTPHRPRPECMRAGLSGTACRRGRPWRPSSPSCCASCPSCRRRPSCSSSFPSAGTAS